jgi:hypothetical protein
VSAVDTARRTGSTVAQQKAALRLEPAIRPWPGPLHGCIVCLPEPVPISYVLQTYFAGAAPASTLCILRGLANPNFLLEIEAIAAV